MIVSGVQYVMVRAGPHRVAMVPNPHRLDTELGPPSWHRVSTCTAPPLATVRVSNSSLVWYALPSVSTQHVSRHEPSGSLALRAQWMSVVASCVRGLQSLVDVP